jgi:hypothetical protein
MSILLKFRDGSRGVATGGAQGLGPPDDPGLSIDKGYIWLITKIIK